MPSQIKWKGTGPKHIKHRDTCQDQIFAVFLCSFGDGLLPSVLLGYLEDCQLYATSPKGPSVKQESNESWQMHRNQLYLGDPVTPPHWPHQPMLWIGGRYKTKDNMPEPNQGSGDEVTAMGEGEIISVNSGGQGPHSGQLWNQACIV